jgi:hypothetical protein
MEAFEDVALRARMRYLALRKQPARQIYVMPAREYLKIGMAIDPAARWRTLSSANPFIELPIYVSRSMASARMAEREIHRRLRQYQVLSAIAGREWFSCSRQLAIEIATQVTDEWATWEQQDDRSDYGTAILRAHRL